MMIAILDDAPGYESPEDMLALFARKLEKHATQARSELAAIAALPDGPRIFRAMRNRGEIPVEVVTILRELDPHVMERLEGREDA